MSQPPVAFPFADFVINPRTSWARFFNPQLFISVNSGDAPLENHVLSRVGSYGKQLGVLLDAAQVLAARLPSEELTPSERGAIDALTRLRDDVEDAKAEFRGEPAPAELSRRDVDRLLDRLDDLRRTDPPAHRALIDRLREGLDVQPTDD
jgi:hypothetical protein